MSVIDSGFSGERGIFLRVVRICGGGSCEAFLVFENCDPPEEGDLYAAEEDTTVRIADTAPAGGETIYYMLMFTLKNKEARMTERIPYTGTVSLREAIAQAVADGVLTQEEFDGVGVAFIDVTAGEEYDPVASGNARFMRQHASRLPSAPRPGNIQRARGLGFRAKRRTRRSTIRWTERRRSSPALRCIIRRTN